MFDDDEESPESELGPDVPDSTPDVPDSTPDIPEAPDPAARLPDPGEAPPELRRAFVRQVVVFNVALFVTALGVMLVGFEGRFRDGGGLVAVGLATFGYGLWLYRNRPRVE